MELMRMAVVGGVDEGESDGVDEDDSDRDELYGNIKDDANNSETEDRMTKAMEQHSISPFY